MKRNEAAKQVLGEVLRDGFQKIANSLNNAMAGVEVTNKILREVRAQEEKWGLQDHPDGTGPESTPLEGMVFPGMVFLGRIPAAELMARAKELCDQADRDGTTTWPLVLLEEVFEAFAEDPSLDNLDLDKELIQSAAVLVSWVKNRERRRLQIEQGEGGTSDAPSD